MNNKKLYALFKDNKDIMIHMSILVKIIALLNQNIITLIYLFSFFKLRNTVYSTGYLTDS